MSTNLLNKCNFRKERFTYKLWTHSHTPVLQTTHTHIHTSGSRYSFHLWFPLRRWWVANMKGIQWTEGRAILSLHLPACPLAPASSSVLFIYLFFIPSTFSALFSLTLFHVRVIVFLLPDPRLFPPPCPLGFCLIVDVATWWRGWRSGGLNAERSFKSLESNTHSHTHKPSHLSSYNLFSETRTSVLYKNKKGTTFWEQPVSCLNIWPSLAPASVSLSPSIFPALVRNFIKAMQLRLVLDWWLSWWKSYS